MGLLSYTKDQRAHRRVIMLKFFKNTIVVGKTNSQKRITPHMLIQTLNAAAKEKVNNCSKGFNYER